MAQGSHHGHPNTLSDTPCGLCVPRCPVMAGGLFSIDKKYFSELGMYDPGLDVWGGENMEISFKVWMCGGEIEIVPCSRVGHIFRNDNPYSFPKDRVRTVERNLARVAEVWLDEYKELFYGHAYHLLHSVDVGDLSQQIQLRQRLRCKTFRWYLHNVYPDLEAPLVKASGQLVNVALAGCIAVQGTSLAFEECDANSMNQKFNYTWLRLVQHGELCLAPAGVLGAVGLRPCQGRNRSLACKTAKTAWEMSQHRLALSSQGCLKTALMERRRMDTHTNCLSCTKSHGSAPVSLVQAVVQNALKWHSLLLGKNTLHLGKNKCSIQYTDNFLLPFGFFSLKH
uniref:Galactosyltransferase C-terminal domain-containing protein n=1 Tax=Zonotrichia albicollis TaxID=44394 RepID=A0A8D2MSG0_ZONAL